MFQRVMIVQTIELDKSKKDVRTTQGKILMLPYILWLAIRSPAPEGGRDDEWWAGRV